MSIGSAEAQRIARDLIAEIRSEWVKTPHVRWVQQDGYHLLEVEIENVPYARFVKGPLDEGRDANSFVRFNPLSQAVDLVIESDRRTQSIDSSLKDSLLRSNAKARIVRMLKSVLPVFSDAIWQARIIGETLVEADIQVLVGNTSYARTTVNTSLDAIRSRIQKHFSFVPRTRDPKINHLTINIALRTFLADFKKSGVLPSQNRFAKALEVTPKAWREYLKKNQFEKHEITVRQLLEQLQSNETAKE